MKVNVHKVCLFITIIVLSLLLSSCISVPVSRVATEQKQLVENHIVVDEIHQMHIGD